MTAFSSSRNTFSASNSLPQSPTTSAAACFLSLASPRSGGVV